MQDDMKIILQLKEEEYKPKIKSIENDFVMFPKNTFNSRPFLKIMIDPKFEEFCKLIYFHHRKTYEIESKFLPLLPGSKIRSSTSSLRKEIFNDLVNIEQVESVVNKIYYRRRCCKYKAF